MTRPGPHPAPHRAADTSLGSPEESAPTETEAVLAGTVRGAAWYKPVLTGALPGSIPEVCCALKSSTPRQALMQESRVQCAGPSGIQQLEELAGKKNPNNNNKTTSPWELGAFAVRIAVGIVLTTSQRTPETCLQTSVWCRELSWSQEIHLWRDPFKMHSYTFAFPLGKAVPFLFILHPVCAHRTLQATHQSLAVFTWKPKACDLPLDTHLRA